MFSPKQENLSQECKRGHLKDEITTLICQRIKIQITFKPTLKIAHSSKTSDAFPINMKKIG